jgi:hypothetical protein
LKFVIDHYRCQKPHPPLSHTISTKLDIALTAWSHTFKPHGRKEILVDVSSDARNMARVNHTTSFLNGLMPFCEGCCDHIPALTRQNELLYHEIRNKNSTIKWLQFSVFALGALLLKIMLAPTILHDRLSGSSCKSMLLF